MDECVSQLQTWNGSRATTWQPRSGYLPDRPTSTSICGSWQPKQDLLITCMTMLRSSLPFGIIIQKTDYFHITSIIKFSRASYDARSCCERRLEVSQYKLSILSRLNGKYRNSTTQCVRIAVSGIRAADRTVHGITWTPGPTMYATVADL